MSLQSEYLEIGLVVFPNDHDTNTTPLDSLSKLIIVFPGYVSVQFGHAVVHS